MSFVYDLRATLLFSTIAIVMLWNAFRLRAASVESGLWTQQLAIALLFCVLLADGIQRRWRGDPRTREREPDVRSLAAAILGFAGLAAVGVWSLAAGHRALAWGPLLGGGLAGAAVVAFVAWNERLL